MGNMEPAIVAACLGYFPGRFHNSLLMVFVFRHFGL